MMRAGDIVIIAMVAVFGTRAVAGNAIGEVLTQFNYMPVFGIATATVMLVAKSLGQNDLQGIKQIISRSFWISFLTMLPLALTIFLFGSPLTALYTKDPGALAASLSVILFSLLGTPLTAGTRGLARVRQRASSLLCDHYRHVGDSDWLRLSDGG